VPYARISATLPADVLAAADRRAKTLGRSRSWVIAEALRTWTAEPASTSPAPRMVREAGPALEAQSGLGEQRLAQLRADLALTPERRVIEAERTAKATYGSEARWNGVLTFDRYEDYLAWKRREALRQ